MKGHVTKRVALVVDGQFDDAVNESPPPTTSPTWIDTTTPSNPVADQVHPTQNNTVPAVSHTTTTTTTTTTTNIPPPPPPHPWWSLGPTTILVLHHSSVIPPVMALSAAPRPPLVHPTAVLPEHLPPLPRPQSLHHHQGVVWSRTASPNTHVALPHHHYHHCVPIAATPRMAPRPVRPTYLPIAPRPAALGGNETLLPVTSTTTNTNTMHHKKRRWSMKKLPTTREKLCHSPQHGGDDIGTASSYGTKLVDRIIHHPSSNDHQSRPFHNLLSHHPNAALIPHSGVRSERIIPLTKLVLRDEQCACPVSVRHNMRPADVLLGRGGTSNRNLGNLYFRQLISYYRCFYHVLPKGSKGQLSRNICNYVRLSGGRFLEKRRRHDEYWYECGDARALAKCSQALRESNCVSSTHGDSGNTSAKEEEDDDDDDYYESDENDDDDNDDNDDDDSSIGSDTPNAKKMRSTK